MTDVGAAQVPDQRTVDATTAVRDYFAAWNAHDGGLVARLVSGSYTDPTVPRPLRGEDLAANVFGVCASFPDVRFEIESELCAGDTVVVTWRMRGTNTGEPLPGAPAATNASIDLPGVDVITTRDGRIVDVTGYFDQQTFITQLGFQAIVTPKDEWPVSFGLSTRVDLGNTTTPGAISFTWIETDDVAEVSARTQEIVTALASDPAFIGFRSMGMAGRYATLTLWTSPEAAAAALARNAPHNEAMDRMWQGGFASAGFTSIWAPFRVNAQFAGCTECGRYVAIEAGAQTASCECGGTVEVASYL